LFLGPLLGVVPGRGNIFDVTVWSKIYDGDLLRESIQDISLPVHYGEDQFINFLAFTNDKLRKVSSRKQTYYIYCRYGNSMTNSTDASFKIFSDYNLFKLEEIKRLNNLPINPDILMRVHSESLWCYRASINMLLKDKILDETILKHIADVEQYEYIKLAKQYFCSHPEDIWTSEMNFMISNYKPQEYLNWCKANLPKESMKERIILIIKRIMKLWI